MAPHLASITADVASALVRLLRTQPGGADERTATHCLQGALCTCRLDSSPRSVSDLVRAALEAGWDRHAARGIPRGLTPPGVPALAKPQTSRRRLGR